MALPHQHCRFEIECPETQFGDQLCCVGAPTSLGQWDPTCSAAVTLTTDAHSFPKWFTDRFPVLPGHGEFKFAIRTASGTVRWEAFLGNRSWPAGVGHGGIVRAKFSRPEVEVVEVGQPQKDDQQGCRPEVAVLSCGGGDGGKPRDEAAMQPAISDASTECALDDGASSSDSDSESDGETGSGSGSGSGSEDTLEEAAPRGADDDPTEDICHRDLGLLSLGLSSGNPLSDEPGNQDAHGSDLPTGEQLSPKATALQPTAGEEEASDASLPPPLACKMVRHNSYYLQERPPPPPRALAWEERSREAMLRFTLLKRGVFTPVLDTVNE